jgi:tRNA dimethylallyltransferase
MFSEPELPSSRLEALRDHLNDLAPQALQRWATVLDPEWEMNPREKGRHRLTRRIEMALLTGRSLSWWHREEEAGEEPLAGVVVVLDLPRELLYQRINARVERMVEGGLVEEVEALVEAGFGPRDPGMTGAGYREIAEYLQGGGSLEEATARIQQSHRNYARRQTTWFRHQLPGGSHRVDGRENLEELSQRVCALWNEGRTARA